MLGATMTLQAIVYRKPNCFRKTEENYAFARLYRQRKSQEGLLANVAEPSGIDTVKFDSEENEEIEIFPKKLLRLLSTVQCHLETHIDSES
ncbi:unnamed protein product [Rodentolepis nana]|uniref:Uncharacterized protein n=1 Tax=Rodentolepis nana TaxID=102285 RepID=A0A0R3U0Q1_RODNA|nr:unnamed protein product [Rodentolepis nana]